MNEDNDLNKETKINSSHYKCKFLVAILLMSIGVYLMVEILTVIIGVVEIAMVFLLWRVRDITHSEKIEKLITAVMIALGLIALYHFGVGFGVLG